MHVQSEAMEVVAGSYSKRENKADYTAWRIL